MKSGPKTSSDLKIHTLHLCPIDVNELNARLSTALDVYRAQMRFGSNISSAAIAFLISGMHLDERIPPHGMHHDLFFSMRRKEKEGGNSNQISLLKRNVRALMMDAVRLISTPTTSFSQAAHAGNCLRPWLDRHNHTPSCRRLPAIPLATRLSKQRLHKHHAFPSSLPGDSSRSKSRSRHRSDVHDHGRSSTCSASTAKLYRLSKQLSNQNCCNRKAGNSGRKQSRP